MRILLVVLLAAGLVALFVVEQPAGLLLATLVMLLTFLLGCAKLAVDVVDLIRADLVADGVTLVAIGIGAATFTMASSALIGGLLAVALAAQVVRLVAGARAPARSLKHTA
jgi:hypothetical protein